MTTFPTMTTVPETSLSLPHVLEGQTAAQLVVAADELGWWQTLLDCDEDTDGPVVPASGVQRSVARALARIGWLTETDVYGHQGASAGSVTGYRLTDTGREVAVNRGFVRVVVRGWEPTFRAVGGPAANGDAIAAHPDAAAVARGCTDIARRHPETIAAIAGRLDAGPGITIDLGCADAGRVRALAGLAPQELLIGVDLEADVVSEAGARLKVDGLDGRITLHAGNVAPGPGLPSWIDAVPREDVTTAMSFFLLHQLASDGGGIGAVLRGWMDWFPNLERLVIGDGLLSEGASWSDQPWFAPTYELYHELTGVRLWWEHEYLATFAALGWKVVERRDADHEIVVTYILER